MIETGTVFQVADFYKACNAIAPGSIRVLMHPDDLPDLEAWDANLTGDSFREALIRVVQDGTRTIRFSEWEVHLTEDVLAGIAIVIDRYGSVESLVKPHVRRP